MGGAGVGGLRADVRGFGEERAGQRDDRARHRGGEQHGLPLLGHHPQDLLDVRQETQIEHLVGLVEDQHLDLAQDELGLVGQVEQAAGGAHDQVDALLQSLDLLFVRGAAVDREHLERAGAAARGGGQAGGGDLEVLGDLDAQLTGGHDHERAGRAVELAGGLTGRDAVQQRDAEPVGLAHAGTGLPDEIGATQCQREGEFLDGERVGDPALGERGDDLRADAEFGEAGGGVG